MSYFLIIIACISAIGQGRVYVNILESIRRDIRLILWKRSFLSLDSFAHIRSSAKLREFCFFYAFFFVGLMSCLLVHILVIFMIYATL
jgi:hypothetical protein